MFIQHGSPALSNLIFSGNRATRHGGGIYILSREGSSNPTLDHVIFRGNHADQGGGGISNFAIGPTLGVGGNSNPLLTNVIFSGNSAGDGGGFYNNSSDSGTTSSPTLINVTFSGNQASNNGGAFASVTFRLGATSSPTLTNVTFSGNSALGDGGAIWNLSDDTTTTARLTLSNSILWGGSDVIYNNPFAVTSVSNSIVQGSGGSGKNWKWGVGTDGGGNLDLDPLFVASITAAAPTTTGNLRLREGSPAIDAGSDSVPLPSTDLDGKARISGAKVDMGAYEFVVEDPVVVDPRAVLPTAARLTLSGSGRFGASRLGVRSRARHLLVRNVGGTALPNLAVGISGGRRQFTAGAPRARDLAPGAGTTVRVVFRPRVKGRSKAVLTVSGLGVAEVSLPLSGLGRSVGSPTSGRPQTPRQPDRIVR